MKANHQVPTPRGGLSIASAAYGIPRGSNLMPRRLKMADHLILLPKKGRRPNHRPVTLSIWGMSANRSTIPQSS
jgi:hypothetical protein